MTPLSLLPDFDLADRNTLALIASSRFGVTITEPGMLPALFDTARTRTLPVRILGGGSNVVLAPAYDGITALVAIKGKRIVAADDGATVVEAAAGESWHDLVLWTVEQGLGGLENLALIPGTVGAAPVQNIGAYGAELADMFESLLAYDRNTGAERIFTRDDCAFAYRDSIFKHEPDRYVVLSVQLRLPGAWTPNLNFAGLSDLAAPDLTPRRVMDRVIELRTSKLPDWRVTPNAGSFFQNPIVSTDAAQTVLAEFPAAPNFPQADGRTKLSAGWLIEKAGLKGFSMGPVGMSERHALVVVNHGGATQADVSALSAHVKETVKARFGIQLHEEPIFC
ncbi:UDP-N-acetylmuramate dehydrogenase [Devosia lucknowensis]|uniref:UDP-N-acetylenolpyruvoylglucosamine reductase n=1 Tax=Devosia lucknowensis TaxID=1096929 RepID=A0A1Y6EXD8_9HYPH|nr:UDP-N-acetylmuramate dehydrogenase [Devosia lucknowensis]SMQ64933.1 UDP-N-acetylmuramate dehydrogenase [Devosia lucknowensis]